MTKRVQLRLREVMIGIAVCALVLGLLRTEVSRGYLVLIGVITFLVLCFVEVSQSFPPHPGPISGPGGRADESTGADGPAPNRPSESASSI